MGRTSSTGGAAQGAHAGTAAAAGSSPSKQRGKAGHSAPASAAATAASSVQFHAGENVPAYAEAVGQLCENLNPRNSGKAAANGASITWEEVKSIEKLHKEFLRVHTLSQEQQAKLKFANKEAATDKAALAKVIKENVALKKRYNEVAEKLKLNEASKQHGASAKKSKRAREAESDPKEAAQNYRGCDRDATSAGDRISSNDDSQRQRINNYNTHATSGTVHPDRLQQVPDAHARSAQLAGDRLQLFPSHAHSGGAVTGKVVHSASHCLVIAGVGARAHWPAAEILRTTIKRLIDSNLCCDADNGNTTPIDIHKLSSFIPGNNSIHWKVVFKSATAAEVVLERSLRLPITDITLRPFLDRHQRNEEMLREHGAAARPAEPRRVTREISETTHTLVRGHSMDSVVCVPPTQTQWQTKQEEPAPSLAPPVRTAAPLQFTTRRALEGLRQSEPVQQPSAATVPQQPQQQQPEHQHPAGGAHGQDYASYVQQYRPMPPMMPMYHGGAPPYGFHMQPRPQYYAAPMAYAPGPYMVGPEAYHGYGYHPQL